MNMLYGLMLAAAATTGATAETFLKETFSDAAWTDRWTTSTFKPESDRGTWGWGAGEWSGDAEIQKGMVTNDNLKFYATSTKLSTPASTGEKDLVVQFTVKHEKREYSFCGGGYIKLMKTGTDQTQFNGDTPYSIMFGPDLCGYDVSRIHLIFNHKGENLLKDDEIKLEYADKNEYTHLYTLVVHPDGSYEVLFDNNVKATGTLVDDWAFPKKQIDDPTDSKPSDWVDETEIPDPEDVKPEGWDDIPEQIVDPEATKPEDWDDEDDGEWEAPLIDNPEFKGEWKQKMIPNPAYKGEWKAKQVANPDYDPNVHVYNDLGVAGFELWVVNEGSVFDNVIVTDSVEEAKAFAEETWSPFVDKEKKAKEDFDAAKKAAEEAEKKAAEDDNEDAEDVDDEDEDASKDEL